MLNLGSDACKRVYRWLPLEIVADLKSRAKGAKGLTVKSVPMPGKRDQFRVTVTAHLHSWAASNDCLAEFYCSLPEDMRTTLSCYREMGV